MQGLVPIVIGRQPSRRMPGALFLNCATFSASDMRRIRSSARVFKGCAGSRQTAGALMAGARLAAMEKESARSEALNETTDVPPAFFISIVLNLAVLLLAMNEIASGPWSFPCSTVPAMVETFRAPPADAKMSNPFAKALSPIVTSNNLLPGPSTIVSTSPIMIV